MRSKNSNEKKLKFALIASLIACFVFVFGTTLALGVFDVDVNAEEQTASVAYADAFSSGGTNPISLGDTSALAFGFPGTSTNKTSWSKTYSLASVDFVNSNTGNVSFYKPDDNKYTFNINAGTTDGKSSNYYEMIATSGTTPEVHCYSLFNIDCGSFIRDLAVNNTQYIVTVSINCTVSWVDTGTNAKTYQGLIATSNYIGANSNAISEVTSSNTSVTLSAANPYVAYRTYWTTKNQGVRKTGVKVTANSVTITITQNNTTYNESTSKIDGGDPVVSSAFSNLANDFANGKGSTTTATGTGCEPYITTKDSSLWPVYDKDLESVLSANLDSMSNGSGTMQSYTNKSLGTVNGSNKYYKYSQVEYVDTYNYYTNDTLQELIEDLYTDSPALTISQMQLISGAGNKYISSFDKTTGAIAWGTSNVNYCSGIKSVQVGETTINCYSSSAGSEFTVSGETVGYAYVRKIDNGRVVVQIYMYTNATVTTIVKDFGEGSCSSTVVFKGIDPVLPDKDALLQFSTEDNVISTSTTLTKWVRTNTLTVDVIDNIPDSEYESSTYTPYVWFYSVKKHNDNAKSIPNYSTYSSYDEIKASGLRPIAVTNFNSFVYNFEDGTAEGINAGSQISGGTDCTGAGYYRFTFYVCDLAGNIMAGDPISFYVMVDYETPVSTTTLQIDNNSTTPTFITSETNGKWSTSQEILKINLVKKNISGNTLLFETNDGTSTLIFKDNYFISLDGNEINAKSINAHEIVGLVNSAYVNITIEDDYSGGTIIKFIIPVSELFAWETSFTMYAGVSISEYENLSTNVDEVLYDGTSFSKNSVVYQGINFTSDIKVYIDNANPIIPEVADSDGNGYLKNVDSKDALTLDITGSRQWFTLSSLKMESILTFTDSIVDTDFANGLKVYYGVKTISQATSVTDFDSVKTFITQYTNKNLSFNTNYASFFDRTAEYDGTKIDGSETDITIDFVQNAGANMRVLVVWAIDQAGNRSSNVKIYYVLADPNTYTVKASLFANAIVGATASIAITNSDDVSSTSFVRGETITMTVSLDDGYVPYQLTKIGSKNTLLLSNETAKINWTISSGYESLIRNEGVEDNSIVMSYVYDDLSTFAVLDKTVTLELKQRQVVGYTITNTSVRYTGLPTVVPITFTDSRSEDSFVYKFRERLNATELDETPTIPGEYQVLVYIPNDDASFVTDDVETVDYIDYTITKGIATVKAVATSSYYGSFPDLKYTVEGIDEDVLEDMKGKGSSVFRGSLKLNVAKASEDYNTLSVGKYAIVQNQEFYIEYYNVTFEGEYHEILQKVINVNILDGEKVYGTTDGEYKFSVDYTQVDSITILDDLLGIKYKSKDDSTQIAIYETDSKHAFIERENGEDVGIYPFINNPSAFAISDENYVINIESIGDYTITKKNIVIDASGNTYVFKNEADAENATLLAALDINYSLGNDTQYADEIVGKLALGTQISKQDGTDEYLYVYKYKILIGTIVDTDNLHFVLADATGQDEYTIYVALPNTVIISLKSTESFTMTYGETFTQALVAFDDNSSKFNVEGATLGSDFETVDWVMSNDALSSQYPNVGTYLLKATSVVLQKQGVQVPKINGEEYVVVVVPFAITVVPAEIIVEPIANNESKGYAELDDEYEIELDIVSIAGHAVYDSNKNEIYHGHAGASILVIKGYIDGMFARAIYDKDNNFIAFGAKNDSVTDNNGVVIGGTNYYSYGVYKEFTSNEENGNYVVKTQIDTTKRLSIDPAKIVIKASEFKGINKVFDGNTLVKYPSSEKAIDINAKLKVASDDVEVTYIANYASFDGEELDSDVGRKRIIFSALGLIGNQASNYVLYYENDDNQVIVDNTTTITIYYLTSESTETTNYILITNGNISLIRSDFTIAKEYDNLTTLTKDAVSIVNRNDDNGNGTAILYNSQSTMQVLYGSFPDKEVSKNYSIDLMLFYPLGNEASEESIHIEQTDKTIDVTLEEVNGVLGIKVYMQGIGAEIKKRVLGVEDFETIDAVDRDYNSTANITFTYKLKDGSLATGDEAYYNNSLITIKGHTRDNAVNVGTYDAIFADYSIDNATFQQRYSIDITELNNYYSGIRQLDVTIDYAKLMPRVEFVSREYNGSTNYTVTYVNKASSDVPALKTLNFSDELVNELKKFSYVAASVNYAYSKEGKNDGNVQIDENGNVVLHNVSVDGMVISEEGENNYLANYVLYGHRYNETTKEYEAVGAITSGAPIDKYEMLNIAGLTKRPLQIKANDIDVEDKVYDGTKNASIKVQLTGSDAIEEDKQYLEVVATATYSRKQIGDNIGVTVKVSELRLKTGYQETKASLLNNYQLKAFTQKISRSIKARPIGFSVSFDTRVYNGEEAIAKNLIKYDLSEMLYDDSDNYSVNTEKGAYYLTKDINYSKYVQVTGVTEDDFESDLTYYNSSYEEIEVTKDTFMDKVASGLYIDGFELLAKEGVAYNPILNNSKEKYINYELSIKSEKPLSTRKLEDLYAYETTDGGIYYGTGLVRVVETDTYDKDRVYYTANMSEVKDEAFFEANKTSLYYAMDGVEYFYYKLPETDKYIEKDDYDALDAIDKAAIDKHIIGFYIYYNSSTNTNMDVYLLEDSYDTTNIMANKVSYVAGEGKIERREVSVTSVTMIDNSSLTKVYDGTTKYFGKQGDDFKFGSGSITNDIETDNIDVADVTANYKTAQAGATQVEFIASGLKAKSGIDYSFNYISTSATSTNKQATITKRNIYVKLADAEIVYGSQISNVQADMKFYLDEACTKEITITDNGWFVKFADFIEVCGLDINKSSENYIGDVYYEQLKNQLYDETYTANSEGSLYKLIGSLIKPTVDISVLGAKQNVNYVAEKFGLKGGSATNFTFVPKYTGNGKNGYSKLIVVKKTIYAVADATKEYTRVYGTDLSKDAVKILFLNELGKDGVVSGETSYDIYTGSLEVVFKKVSIGDLDNIGSESVPVVTARSLINKTVGDNKGLEEGYMYVAYIVATNFESDNYDVKFGTIVNSNGQLKYKFGDTIFTSVPQLTIVLPEIEDVSLSATEKTLTYNGEDRANQLVKGLTDKDVVEIDGSTAKNVKVNDKNEAIAYEGDVIVTRTLLTNEIGYEYVITKNLGKASLLINKASAGLTASKETIKYDGDPHTVSSSSYGVDDAGIGVNPNDYRIEYYLDGKKIDTTKTSIVNAGTYKYTVILTSPSSNYLSEEKSAEFVISPATIEVTVDTTKLVQEYIAGKEYTITYDILDTIGIGVTKEDTEFKFYRKGKETTITKAGRYNFVIGLTDDKDEIYNIRSDKEGVDDIINVVFVNNTGNLDLTVSEIDSFNKDEEKVANITLKNAGDSLLADEFTTRYVYANNILAEDDLYWASIDQYMDLISTKIGAGATLEAIVRMNLTYGVNSQTLGDKEAIVTVSLPTEITDLSSYALYTTNSSGNLVQLKSSDYIINGDGTITYTTKYLGSLVFVKLGDEPLSQGAAIGIGVGVTAFVLLIVGTVVTIVIKKKKLNAMLK